MILIWIHSNSIFILKGKLMTKFDAHKWIKDFKSRKLNEAEVKTKTYELGDMWSNDFDYVGMLKVGAQATYEMGLENLQKLYDSFEDVNYHSENKFLGYAIDEIENPGQDANQAMENIEDYLEDFRNACLKTLKDMGVKWNPPKPKPQMGTGTSGGFRVG
jgi:hypothetical protein